MAYYLAWYDKVNDNLIGEVKLENDNEIELLFNIKKDEYPGDCLIVRKKHKQSLEKISNISIDIRSYDYFVELISE
jgi:hypothetical protein